MTTLVRWNPTRNVRNRDMRRMHTDIDRLMESFFETPRVSTKNHSNLALDVAETANGYLISAAVPGIKSEDIDITVEDGILSISGEFSNSLDASDSDSADDGEGSAASAVKFHIRERRYGTFTRKLRLPKDVDAEAIEAKQEDGILTISLAKTEAAQPKKIAVA